MPIECLTLARRERITLLHPCCRWTPEGQYCRYRYRVTDHYTGFCVVPWDATVGAEADGPGRGLSLCYVVLCWAARRGLTVRGCGRLPAVGVGATVMLT